MRSIGQTLQDKYIETLRRASDPRGRRRGGDPFSDLRIESLERQVSQLRRLLMAVDQRVIDSIARVRSIGESVRQTLLAQNSKIEQLLRDQGKLSEAEIQEIITPLNAEADADAAVIAPAVVVNTPAAGTDVDANGTAPAVPKT